MKYNYEKSKGTKVMFNFTMKIFDDIEKSPSIFTERSLLNNIDHSPKYNDQSQIIENSQSNFGQGNSILLHR